MAPTRVRPKKAPHIRPSASGASRASVTASGFTASSSWPEVNASGCSCNPRRRSARYVATSPGASRRTAMSDDFKIALHLPVGDRVEPLPPFPLARRRIVIDEIVAEPIAGKV